MPLLPKKKMGAPKKDVPMQIVDTACQLNASMPQVIEALSAQGYKLNRATIEREIKRLHRMTFAAYRDQKAELTRLKLIQKAVKMALDGHATMLIFSLKNMCGWSDRFKEDDLETDEDRAKVVITLPANGREAKETK